MFRAKQDSEQRKIRLPKRTVAPGPDYLQFVIQQAFLYRGQDVEVVWTDNTATNQFRIVAKAERDSTEANWQLWEDNGRDNKLVWSHNTIDTELIENMISMLDINTGEQPLAQPKTSTSPISPYRNLFSASYHGIAPPNTGLGQSLTRMRPAETRKPSPNDLDTVNNAQTVSTNVLAPVTLPDNGPSYLVKDIITEGLRQLAGSRQIMPVYAISNTTVTGTLDQSGMTNGQLIRLITADNLTGKLEFNAQDMHAEIFILNGALHSAFAANNQGNEAMIELLMWTPGGFRFTVDEQSPISNITNDLRQLESESLAIHEQFSHLEKAGFKPLALIIKTQESASDSELRLFLMKNRNNDDIDTQISLYRQLEKKFTLVHLLAKRPMTKSVWVPVLFTLFTCGLIEFKPPLSMNDEQLEFLGEAKAAVQLLKSTFIRKETGILNYPAIIYFLQYEYLRFQTYDWPLSLVIFEMNKQSAQAMGGLDLINHEEAAVALQRISAVKRPLDLLGHFEAINFAILLPNTSASTANQVAHQIIQALRTEPLSSELDDKQLKLSFGIATIPNHCDSVEGIIVLAKKALLQAKAGHFPVILAPSVNENK